MGNVVRRGLVRVIGIDDLPPLPKSLDPRSDRPDFSRLPCDSPIRFLLGIVRVMRRDFLGILSLGLLTLVFELSSPLLVRKLLASIADAARGGAGSVCVLQVVLICGQFTAIQLVQAAFCHSPWPIMWLRSLGML